MPVPADKASAPTVPHSPEPAPGPRTLPLTPLPAWAQKLLIALTVVTVCVPAADLAFGFDPTPLPTENRVLAELPGWHWTATALQTFPAKFEAWNKDHFGLRSTLIHWHSVLMLDVLGVSPTADVIIGRDGWLFMGKNKTVDTYRCLAPFDKAELDAEVATIRGRRDWLAARGIRYLNVWAPVKMDVYPEFLPGWVRKTANPCRLDQWLARMNKERLPVLDLRPAMQAAKAEGLAYIKTDTHWNPRGGYFGYRALVDRLRVWWPKLAPLPASRVRYRDIDRLGGDLAALMDLKERYRGPEVWADILDKRCNTASMNGLSRPKGIKLEAFECPPAGNGAAAPRLLLLGDSYQNALIPFLAETMGRTVTAEFAGFDKDLIEHEKPAVVVEIHVQRQMQPDR